MREREKKREKERQTLRLKNFKKLGHKWLASLNFAGQASRLETQRRTNVAIRV